MSEENNLIAPGVEVRLKHDPGRRGITTKNTVGKGDSLRYQVHFSDGKQFVRWYELERANEDDGSVFTLLEQGRFGRLSDLRRNLTHVQLTGKLANLVYSMDATNTDFYAYQFKPVLSFLESPSNGLLIADEVGLGKTIEAGLIWTELRARFDARRLLIICPAMLREKWRDEMASKFSVDAEILSARELLQTLKSGTLRDRDGRGLVCGLQSIRPPKGWDEDDDIKSPQAELARFLEAEAGGEYLFDLVIIDESHYLRNPDTQSAKIARLVRGVTEHIVLLSATPVNLHEDDLFHQLNLIDPTFFTDRRAFPQVLKANEPLLRARELVRNPDTKKEEILALLKLALEQPLLSNNQQLRQLIDFGLLEADLSDNSERVRLMNRIEKINLLTHAVTRTRKAEVQELRVIRRPHSYFVEMHPIEENAYKLVTNAILDYADTRDVRSGFLLASPQRQASSCLYAAAKSWKKQITAKVDQLYEDFGIEEAEGYEEKVAPILESLRERVVPKISLADLREHDSKYAKFRSVLLDYLDEHPTDKIVVFSYYPGTLHYLQERLTEEGIKAEILHGSVKETKQEIICRFKSDSGTKILLSSEVASEGVDLQFCRVLVNYDLPWNPMKVEQRIGRIDRIGQQARTISILNLGHAKTIDERIYNRLLNRLGIFEKSLGGMESILGPLIQELSSELLTKKMTAEEQDKQITQSALAIERTRQDHDRLEKEASHMIAHGGYILEQVHAAHAFKKRITSEDLMIYVKDFLTNHARGSELRQITPEELCFSIRLDARTAASLDDFMRLSKLHGMSLLATGEARTCYFKNKLDSFQPKHETINQFHPLIRFISKVLRDKDEGFYPLVSVQLSEITEKDPAPGVYAFALRRWSFAGLKQEEELSARMVSIDTGDFLDANVSWGLLNRTRLHGDDWIAGANLVSEASVSSAIEACMDRLDNDFEKSVGEKVIENEDRVNFQRDSARRHLDRQADSIRKRIDTLRQRGRDRMIPLQEAQLRKLNDKFDATEEKFKARLNLERHSFDVCFGIIRLGGKIGGSDQEVSR